MRGAEDKISILDPEGEQGSALRIVLDKVCDMFYIDV
jgi:hypothetical protein